jgi:hypothetical protein
VAKARSPHKSGVPERALQTGMHLSYSQTLDLAGKLDRGENTLSFLEHLLITDINFWPNKLECLIKLGWKILPKTNTLAY